MKKNITIATSLAMVITNNGATSGVNNVICEIIICGIKHTNYLWKDAF